MSDLTVPNEIRRQLGQKALYMLGAWSLAGDETSLSFRIKGSPRWKAIRIRLTPLDVYEVTFFRPGRAPTFEVEKKVYDEIYVENLHDLIARETGLALSL